MSKGVNLGWGAEKQNGERRNKRVGEDMSNEPASKKKNEKKKTQREMEKGEEHKQIFVGNHKEN